MLFGLALLPSRPDQERLIEFQRRHRALLPEPVLGLDQNVPHLSVLQCPFREELLNPAALNLLASRVLPFRPSQRPIFTHAYYQPLGRIFAGVSLAGWDRKLQQEALIALEPLIDCSRIDRSGLGALNQPERANQERYGYRFVGESYRPHITLGATDHRFLDPGLMEDFEAQFTGTPIDFTRLAFYRSGAFGSAQEIIASHTFR